MHVKSETVYDYTMVNSEHKGRGLGAVLLLSASLIWGVAFVAQSAGMEYVGPYTFTAVRSALAALGMALLMVILNRTGTRSNNAERSNNADKKTLWRAGLIMGVIMTIASNLQQVALVTTSAGKAGFITSLYIVFVPIFGLFIRKRPHYMLWLSVLIALAGLYFLSIRGDFSMSGGDILVLISAVFFALHILFIDHYAPKVDAIRLNCIQFSVTAVLSGILMFVFEEPKMTQISSAWLTIVYAGLFSGSGAYTLQLLGQRRVEPTTASLLLSPENAFAALAGWVLLGQRLTPRELLGCALVFIAVIGSQLPWRRIFGRKSAPVSAEPELAEATGQESRQSV